MKKKETMNLIERLEKLESSRRSHSGLSTFAKAISLARQGDHEGVMTMKLELEEKINASPNPSRLDILSHAILSLPPRQP